MNRAALGRAMAVACVVMAGCATAPAPQVARVMAGERQVGAFVSPYAYEWFIRGSLADSRGEYREAAKAYQRAAADFAVDPLVCARLAYAWERAGKPDRADDVLEDALADHPDSEALHLAAGKIAEHRGRWNAAIAAYVRAEESAPQSELGPLALAHVLAAQHDEGRAQTVLVRFIQRRGAGTTETLRAQIHLALLRGDVDTAVIAVEALTHGTPAGSEAIKDVAAVALAQDDVAAVARLLGAVPDSARDPVLWFRTLVRLQRMDDAEAVLAGHPAEAFGGAVNYAGLFVELGRPEHALELVKAQVGTDPAATFVAARAEAALGHTEKSAALLASLPVGTSVDGPVTVLLRDLLLRQGMNGLGEEVIQRTATP